MSNRRNNNNSDRRNNNFNRNNRNNNNNNNNQNNPKNLKNSKNPNNDTRRNNSSSNSNQYSLKPFDARLCKKLFRHQHDQRKFVLSALTHQNEGDVARLLASDDGRERVRELLSTSYTLNAGDSSQRFSFQRVAVPLCSMMSHVVRASCSSDGKALLNVFDRNETFVDDYIDHVRQLVARPNLLHDDGHRADKTSFEVASVLDTIEPLVGILLETLTTLTNSRADAKWTGVVETLREAVDELYEDSKQWKTTCGNVQRCWNLLKSVREQQEAEARALAAQQLHQDQVMAERLQIGVDIPLENEPLPGELRDDGPRHDNDKKLFRAIRVLPTREEVVSPIKPYLPRQKHPENASPFIAESVDRHLDVQFRLMREDMLAPVRRGVRAFVEQRPLCRLRRDEVSFTFNDESRSGDRVICSLYRNTTVTGFTPDMKSGLCVNIKFDQHPSLKTAKRSARKAFWENGRGSRALQSGSLVVLVFNAPCDPKYAVAKRTQRSKNTQENNGNEADVQPLSMVLGTVMWRGRDDLGRHNDYCKSLQIQPMGSADIVTLLSLIGSQPDPGHEHVLLQVRGHFFAGYQPVLTALQRQDIAKLPFLEKLVPYYDAAADDDELSCPAFVDDDTFYDIRCVCAPSARNTYWAAQVQVSDYYELRDLLKQHQDELILDETQIDAFALALSREVALIQGPPGTGKTYVGVQIVRALVANCGGRVQTTWHADADGIAPPALSSKPLIFPILCVCYTNHALDQFLEHLIDTNVVSLDEVVRVGGRSRSEKLQAANLREKAMRQPRSKEFGRLKRQCNEVERDMKNNQKLSMVNITTNNIPKDFEDWIAEEEPEQYYAITANMMANDDNDDDNFTVKGGFKASLKLWLDGITIDRQHPQRQQRYDLWNSWVKEYREDMVARLSDSIDAYERLVEQAQALRAQQDLGVLREAKVVGFTTSGAAKYSNLLHQLRPRVVVCEEAGEVFEAHVVASLTSSAQSLILIGDHQQLRPKPSEYSLSVETNNGYDLDVSLFERLVQTDKIECCQLNTQRRMRPEISALIRAPLYNTLVDHECVLEYPLTPKGFDKPLYWLDHHHPESSEHGQSSKSNVWEAEMTVALVKYVVRQGYSAGQIAVLTPYVGQLLLLRRELQKQNILMFVGERDQDELDAIDDSDANLQLNNDNDDSDDNDTSDDDNDDDDRSEEPTSYGRTVVANLHNCVRLSTVDNFQGEEAEVVLVSTVRSNDQGRTGFLKIDNRVNVMFSRAKHGMYIIGSAQTVRGDKRAKLANFVVDHLEDNDALSECLPLRCARHDTLIEVRKPDDVNQDGGCNKPCGMRLDCGHACPRDCHPDDEQHRIEQCRQACTKLLPCGHECANLCSQRCTDCKQRVLVQLPCGHQCQMSCALATKARADPKFWPKCNVRVQYVGEKCGHKFQVSCAAKTNGTVVCRQRCGGMLACAHECREQCYRCAALPDGEHNAKCSKPCERPLMCGHLCGASPCHTADECPPCSSKKCAVACEHSKCSKPCKDVCAVCAEQCSWKCTEQHPNKQKCLLPCGSACERLPCDVRCSKLLECGHRCPSLCGEKCPPKAFCVECAANNEEYTSKTRDQIVDMIMQSALKDVDLDDDDALSLLLVLSCNHAFTAETLDGMFRLDKFYARTDQGWSRARALDELSANGNDNDAQDPTQRVPSCPTCKTPVAGVRRYSRLINFATINAVQRQWLMQSNTRGQQLADSMAAAQHQLTARDATAKFNDKLNKNVNQLCSEVQTLYNNVKNKAPTKRVAERELAARRRLANDSESEEALAQLCRRNGVAPLSVPAAMVGDLALRSLELKIVNLCSNFDPRRAKQRNKKNNKRRNKKKAATNDNDDDNDDNDDVDAENLAHLEQASKVQTILNLVEERYNELVRVCCEHNLSGRQNNAHAVYARLLLTTADVARQMNLSAAFAAANNATSVLEMRTVCLDRVEELIESKCVPAEQFQAAYEEARKMLSGVRYEPMTEEEKQMIFNAMAPDIGVRNLAYGGHWFKCENGHPYTIGECGGAMQTSKCPECGVTVGGTSHNRVAGSGIAEDYAKYQED